jgi:hypothetical protein
VADDAGVDGEYDDEGVSGVVGHVCHRGILARGEYKFGWRWIPLTILSECLWTARWGVDAELLKGVGRLAMMTMPR